MSFPSPRNRIPTWRFMVLRNPIITVLITMMITLFGYLWGFYVGYNYTYNGLLSTLNLQVGSRQEAQGLGFRI